MEPSQLPPMQSDRELQPKRAEAQAAPKMLQQAGSPAPKPAARPVSPTRRAIMFGVLLIGVVAIGAFASGLVKIPGANKAGPTMTASQTVSGPVDEQNKVHWIGIQIQNITPDIAKSLGSSRTEGVTIRDVRPNSPADKAGFRPDDILTAVDGIPLRQVGELKNKIQLTTVGDTISVTFERHGATETATVRVGLANRCTQPGSPVCSY